MSNWDFQNFTQIENLTTKQMWWILRKPNYKSYVLTSSEHVITNIWHVKNEPRIGNPKTTIANILEIEAFTQAHSKLKHNLSK
jgi:hypothetical protein